MAQHRRRIRSTILAAATGAALILGFVSPASGAPTPAGSETPTAGQTGQVPPADKIKGKLRTLTGSTSVFVQFVGKGAFEQTQPVTVRRGQAAPLNRAPQVLSIRQGIQAKANDVVASSRGKQLYVTSNALPGVALTADAAAIRELAKREDVVKITPIVPKKPGNKGSVQDTRALNTWVERRQTGNGVTIAVIDTGIDYTHADLGGPGTPAAYAEAQALTTLPGAPLRDVGKVIGGWDFVGDAYTGFNAPSPDANPLDCRDGGGHGSHVAGTAAGYGVNADGTTFTGNYSSLTAAEVDAMLIGPGSAPEAQLTALRVFGCDGYTTVVGQALDRVLDPNGDGNSADAAQIVNMSLGSDYSPTDDPENDMINALTNQGVLSVVAAGNVGDLFDVGGAPGNAKSALTVANNVGNNVAMDRLDVLAPAGVAGPAAGQYSTAYNYAGASQAQLRGDVVMAPTDNKFGCDAFAPGSLSGKWVWLQWEENGSYPCGSTLRFNNAQAAGAGGVLLDSPRDLFATGIAGNAGIPGAQVNKASSDALRSSAAAGTLAVQLNPAYLGAASAPSGAGDTLNASSSRGVHGSNGIVKPDVSAPGTMIGSIDVGSGAGARVLTGTSMATPHVAGIAALVYGAGTTDPRAVKSRVMNTAVHDILNDAGVAYGPGRVGSGRVDALNAVDTPAYAFATDDPSLTSLTFGVLEVAAVPVSITKSVTVRNNGDLPLVYTVEYRPATDMPGVDISVPATVTVPAASTATVDVTLSIPNPEQLAKRIDPTMAPTMVGVPRQFLAEESGRLQFTSAGVPALRVPVQAAPKPTANMSAGTALAFPSYESLSTPVNLAGRGISQGAGAEHYESLLAPFELHTSSPQLPAAGLTVPSLGSLDLQYTGASSTVPALAAANQDISTGVVQFGVSTWANWAALTPFAAIVVEIDTNRDGVPDYIMQTSTDPALDAILVTTFRMSDDEIVDQQFANAVGGNIDTNTFDTNTITLPVSVGALGINPAVASPLTYSVSTYSYYGSGPQGLVDSTAPTTWDPVRPKIWFQGTNPNLLLFNDQPGNPLNIRRQAGVTAAKALFLHLHNATGDLSGVDGADGGKAEVLNVSAPATPPVCVDGTPPAVPQRDLSRAAIRSAADVISIDGAGNLYNHRATGSGRLLARVKVGSGWTGVKEAFVTDWNRDGYFDILMQNTNGTLQIKRGGPSVSFFAARTVAAGNWSNRHLTVGLWCKGESYPGVLSIEGSDLYFYRNPAAGSLGTRAKIGAGWSGLYITMVDFDADGRQDLVVKYPNGYLRVYRSNGSGTFISESRPLVATGQGSVNFIRRLDGFTGPGSTGLAMRYSFDGRMIYRPVQAGRFGTGIWLSVGWNNFNILR